MALNGAYYFFIWFWAGLEAWEPGNIGKRSILIQFWTEKYWNTTHFDSVLNWEILEHEPVWLSFELRNTGTRTSLITWELRNTGTGTSLNLYFGYLNLYFKYLNLYFGYRAGGRVLKHSSSMDQSAWPWLDALTFRAPKRIDGRALCRFLYQ